MRLIRILLLIVLVGLLLPYLVTLFYRTGHPVSTLMMWRQLTGAPMSRQWIDFGAISPYLPRSVVAAEDGKFCSHQGVDWDALREVVDDAEDGDVTRGGSTITQQVAKNLFLWPGRSFVRKGPGAAAGLVDRFRAAETANPGNLPQYCRAWPLRPVRCRGRCPICLRPFLSQPVGPRGRGIGGDPAQSAPAQRQDPRPRCAAAGRDYVARAPPRPAAVLGRKSLALARFWLNGRPPTLDLRQAILYKAGLDPHPG